jgi:hypothetical protein
VDGKLRWARVKSLLGGPLRVTAPGMTARTMATVAGKEYDLVPGVEPEVTLEGTAERAEPRVISIAAAEGDAKRLSQYPEDLPFGQVVRDGNLYLGIPERYQEPRALPRLAAVLEQSRAQGWQERQEAARLLARLGAEPAVLRALDELCADAVNVVAHTAAVSLVHIGTPAAMALAERHAARDAVPGLRREVAKARARLGR